MRAICRDLLMARTNGGRIRSLRLLLDLACQRRPETEVPPFVALHEGAM